MRLYIIFFFLIIPPTLYSQDAEEFMYVKNFVVGKAGGVSYNQADFIRKEFLEEVQKLKKYKLVGPEAEDAIKAEQANIEAEGGASMMCRAEECRRRLLRVASADLLVEGSVEKISEDINEIKLDIHGRKVVSTSDSTEKKEQSLNVYSVRYKVQKDEKDNLRMLSLASKILAKKISGARVTKDEEAQVSGLKPLGRDNLDYLARSAIVPGWGQYQRESYFKALLFGGAFFASLAQFSRAQATYNALEKQSQLSLSGLYFIFSTPNVDLSPLGNEPNQQLLPLGIFRRYETSLPYKNSIDEYNSSLRILGGVYALCLLDAYFSSSKYYFDRSEGLSFDFSISPNRVAHQPYSSPNRLESSFIFQLNYRF